MTLHNQSPLPAVVEMRGGDDDAAFTPAAFFQQCLAERDAWRARLLACGALLVRGGPPLTALQFAQFVRGFSGARLLDYVAGASPRIKLDDGVYTSTEYHHSATLSLHNELSYTSRWPAQLYFCCVTPAAQGGETPLADSRAILTRLDETVVRAFKSRRIKYVRNLHGDGGSGYSWQEAFETEDRRAVEAYCQTGGIAFRWKGDGGLTLSEVRPATARHPVTGAEVWFNQADGFHPSSLDQATYDSLMATMPEAEFRLNSYYGDGSPLDPAMLAHIREAMRREMSPVSWRAGDILILDNMLAAHGRMPFTGARKILLAMT